MSDDRTNEILQEYYFANWESIRHLEEQRAQFTNIAVAVIGALVAGFAIGWPDAPEAQRVWLLAGLSACMTILGLLGMGVLAKTYERIDFLVGGMQHAAKRLDERLPDLQLVALQQAHMEDHSSRYRIMSRIRYAAAWAWIFRLVFVAGAAGLVTAGWQYNILKTFIR